MRLRRPHLKWFGLARLALIAGGVLVVSAAALLVVSNFRMVILTREWGQVKPPVDPLAPAGSFDAVESYESRSLRFIGWRFGCSLVTSSYTSFAPEKREMEQWRRDWQGRPGWILTAEAPMTEGLDRDPLDFITLQGLTRWRLGPLWCKGYLRQGEEGVVLHVPYLLIAAIGLLLATPAILGHVRRRPGACPRCGYDWKGLEACPECGRERIATTGER